MEDCCEPAGHFVARGPLRHGALHRDSTLAGAKLLPSFALQDLLLRGGCGSYFNLIFLVYYFVLLLFKNVLKFQCSWVLWKSSKCHPILRLRKRCCMLTNDKYSASQRRCHTNQQGIPVKEKQDQLMANGKYMFLPLYMAL